MTRQGTRVKIPFVSLPNGCYIPDEVFQAIEILKDSDAFYVYFMVFVRPQFTFPSVIKSKAKTGEQICIETKLSESIVARSLGVLLDQNLITVDSSGTGFKISLEVEVPHSVSTEIDKSIAILKKEAVSTFISECKIKTEYSLQMMHLNALIEEVKDKRNIPRYLNDLARSIRWVFAQGQEHTSIKYFTPKRVAEMIGLISKGKPEARGPVFTPSMDSEIKSVTMSFYRSHEREPIGHPESDMKDKTVEKLMKFFTRNNMAVTKIEVAKKVDSEWNNLKIS